MGSRRCCSCAPTAVRCIGCCSDCMTSYRIDRDGNYYLEGGSPFDRDAEAGYGDPFMPQVPGDEIVVSFGNKVSNSTDSIKNSPVKKTFRNIGSYWTWYTAPFMVDFNNNFPSCTSLRPYFDFARPAFNEYQTPGSGPAGDKDNNCYSIHYINPENRCDTAGTETGYYVDHISCNEKPKFDIISNYDPYNAYGELQPQSPIYAVGVEADGTDNPPLMPSPNAVASVMGGSKNFYNTYPCSTEAEDYCCRWNSLAALGGIDLYFTGPGLSDLHIMGAFGIIQNNPNSCNYLGLTKYRRRVIKTWYPWAWQIFSYSLDKLIPFGNETYHWASTGQPTEDGQNSDRLVTVGRPIEIDGPSPTTLYLTPIRHQFLGFAICEHHYDGQCGCFYTSPAYVQDNIIFGRYIPRRFIYRCSGIPMFEFDLYEAAKDGAFSEAEILNFIKLFKSFTVWFPNPDRPSSIAGELSEDTLKALSVVGAVDPRAVPSEEQIIEFRTLIGELSARKYEGLRSTDWRYKATLEIIEANDLYKKAIRKRQLLVNPEHVEYDAAKDPLDYDKVEFDILREIGGFAFTIEDVKNNPKDYVRRIFPRPLGPVRKRCRMNNAPVSQAAWNDDGYGPLVSLTSIYGVNVLVPKTFPLTNTPNPSWVVDDQFITIQAINWCDIGKPYIKAQSSGGSSTGSGTSSAIPRFDGSLENPDPENFPEIYWNEKELAADLNNKLSHIMHTYFYTQPAGWDWASSGPQLNGNKPENNWWNRKYAVTPYTTVGIDNLWTYTNPHSPLSRIAGIDYAWNPNATGWGN